MAEAFIPGTRSARQALIAQILVKERIGSQSRLQERLREDGPREIVLGAGEVAASLAAAEERLCRRR